MKTNLNNTRALGLLIGVFALACVLSYVVVKDAVNQTIERQALGIAEIVASQATTARSVYASAIVEKLKADGFGPSVDSAGMPGHVPIPAQFLKLVGRAASANAHKLYEYKPISKWNLEPTQGLTDDFLRWAWPQLEQQDQSNPSAAIAWQPVSRFEMRDGKRVLRYLSADPASQATCVACHNAYEKMPDVMALRDANGVQTGKQWKPHQLLGALYVTIPLEQAERIAGGQVNEATVFFSGILVASFVALLWFSWRFTQQTGKLLQTEAILHRSQAELARSEANATITTLAASVSHELSTPLGNSLMTSSTMVEQGRSFEKLFNSNQLTRSALAGFVQGILEGNDLILRNLHRADELLQSFRQVANDQTSEQRRYFDLAVTVQEILATLAPTLKSSPNRVVMDIAPGIMLDTFPGPLGQIVINLTNNAFLHAFEGRSDGVLTIRAQRVGDRVQLSFSDNGVGMSEATQARLFQPFFSTKIGQGGTGLGMTIVDNLVRRLGGVLKVQSVLDGGTTFDIEFPVIGPDTTV
jgi:signal transduction histidine kinase